MGSWKQRPLKAPTYKNMDKLLQHIYQQLLINQYKKKQRKYIHVYVYMYSPKDSSDERLHGWHVFTLSGIKRLRST